MQSKIQSHKFDALPKPFFSRFCVRTTKQARLEKPSCHNWKWINLDCGLINDRRNQLLNPKIEKRASGISGIGLFAMSTIAEGETVWYPTMELMQKIHIDELYSLPENEKYDWIKHSYQIGEILYKDTDDTKFMNHSCGPNVVDFHDTLVAARQIQKGEEITWDYLPYMNPYLVFDCRCGSQNCVGTVKKGAMIRVKA